ncbi:MAG: tRNA (adenosine(37)-N6)-threonylcarbamoyltransferase complex dimerization subunit type 1 TsaB [Gemmatimonadetes bacterium]|uniref:tRNA (Adenosine(37)-N6)-threonylcarbamoyltransferase complex dimerization subunit type 1 TsaB n=1 Tax=Candidatus Kutchimonas denitrificans TaxID=3056748 RepID=A0AAE4ZAM0_9BACT|nr:tRNA (adenosine(37)-N6)-threonylcarbamoyltransferase complex dimerization subunit type 1 TsaB [Gemmatimonadota bacterium]NIR73900.1 tRNA (adenosine(37)-N6)-threonylcarbamoyltransferase complex dimerization subunit type 1 TsaB [Candidatus Kutchimonas denitrificans]NIR99706.1 tRNA (adenosine(37)-N6)-threonylcarbamoyltransferase complex dimerization subunit type 1 TsaB [Gemmatimonadota bacterium]NIT65291.1 tRNA (adenosine(37)-N6)-threonylcarbamoyltransferase complex dimerization subunit type 1 T
MRSGDATGRQVWLAVETSTATGSIAIWKDGLAIETTLRIQGTHSERVLPAVDGALAATGTGPEDLTALVVGSGPGSFTGIRIAASMAKGWAMARATPLFAYPSLLAVAAGCGATGPVCALFDARRGQVYAAVYQVSDAGVDQLLSPGAWRIEDLLVELERRDMRPIFAGEGALVHEGAIRDAVAEARILPQHLAVPRAASLLWLRGVAPGLGHVARPESWEPIYVRDWKIEEESG